jgi:methionyl-tRNA formyltransferase
MQRDLRIVFMGTPEFAVESLDILVRNNYNIVGVITAPDKPAGRGQKLRYSAVKDYALEHKLNLLQPPNLKDESFIKELRGLNANLQIIVAFRMLPKVVWDMPEYGSFNLHASLLPDYRGAAPMNWAIINGEKETGVTTFFLNETIDTGAIIFQEKEKINEPDTLGELHDRLKIKGAKLVLKTVQAISENKVRPIDQDTLINSDNEVHGAPKISKDDCRISWDNNIITIYNHIRGLSPFPSAFTFFVTEQGESILFKIFRTKYESEAHSFQPGKVRSDGKNFIKVAGKDGWIEFMEIQQAGKKRMEIKEFLRGFSISETARFT